jgi:hypothetical protein
MKAEMLHVVENTISASEHEDFLLRLAVLLQAGSIGPVAPPFEIMTVGKKHSG